MAAFHPFHRQQVDQGAPHPVPRGILRYPEFPGMMGDGYLDYPELFHLDQGRHEAVHAFVELDILKAFPLISPEGATTVLDGLSAQLVPNTIGNL